MALILAVDTSATPVSCALVQDGKVLGADYSHTGLTHSQTLMPMIEHLLAVTGKTADDPDALAVSVGPGSFTGVRIGVAAIKGLAFPAGKPCIAVSTLEAMAEVFRGLPIGGTVCCVMDARCQQVYTALFATDRAGALVRQTPDEAISLDELKNRLKTQPKPIIFVGDGAQMCYTTLKDDLPGVALAPLSVRYQCATGVAAVAERMFAVGQTVPAAALQPCYLRLPQAERELRARREKETENRE